MSVSVSRTAGRESLRLPYLASVWDAQPDTDAAHLLTGLAKRVGDVLHELAFPQQFGDRGVYLRANLTPPGDEASQALDPWTVCHARNDAIRVGHNLLPRHTVWPYTVAMSTTAETPAAPLYFTLIALARSLARQHRDAGLIPFGAMLGDDFRTLVLESLGQFGHTTDGNRAAREAALDAYRTVAMASLPVSDQERADMECWYREEKAL